MNQVKGLLRDTWWLWLVFFVTVTVLGCTFSAIMFLMYPTLLVVFFYFAMVRYDDQGRSREDL